MPGDLYWRLSVNSSGVVYDASDDLYTLRIESHERVPDSLSAEFADPYKVLSHAIQEGMDVEVELGTDDDHAVVFRGRIYKVDGDFPTELTPTLQITAYDPSMRMGLRKRNRVFSDMALSDIVNDIASNYFTTLDVSVEGDPNFPPPGVRQQEETDLAFLRRLAKTYGCLLYVTAEDSDDTFHFVSEFQVMNGTPVVTVYYGRSDVDNRLLKFKSNTDASRIELPRVLSGIDFDTGQPTEMTTTTPNDPDSVSDPNFSENLAALASDFPDKANDLSALISSASASQAKMLADFAPALRDATTTFITEEQQQAIAQNQFPTSLHGMSGEGETVGIRQLIAQSLISINDVGGRFSGDWFLSEVRHLLDGQGYRSEFACRR
jgi:phage protein D